jgi:hypothetical protein
VLSLDYNSVVCEGFGFVRNSIDIEFEVIKRGKNKCKITQITINKGIGIFDPSLRNSDLSLVLYNGTKQERTPKEDIVSN